MQIFLSYAHTPSERRLARYLADRLVAAGLKVWWDEASVIPGKELEDALRRAARSCDHGVFLVSASWIQRDFTKFELERFAERDPEGVRRIPVLREKRQALAIPARLESLTSIEWLEDEPDVDARFWQLYCAIMDTEPGPAETWTANGQAIGRLAPGRTEAAQRTVQAAAAPIPPSLRCDRAPQWKMVDDLAVEGQHEILLLPGSTGQDHARFLRRIERLLRADPRRSIMRLDWETRPRSEGHMLEELGRIFEVPPGAVATEITGRLAEANLYLLHPCLSARFVDEAIEQYFTEWLPGLIAPGPGRVGGLKCVQPIEWLPDPPLFRAMWSWLRGPDEVDDDRRPQANQLIKRLLSSAGPLLRAVRLRDLENLTDQDMDEFYQLMNLTESQRKWLDERIHSRGARTPREIFDAVDQDWAEMREH